MPTHIVCIQPNIHSPSNSSPGIISTDVTPTTLRTNITLTTLSTGATVGITVEVTCAIILFVGFLAGVLLYYCISNSNHNTNLSQHLTNSSRQIHSMRKCRQIQRMNEARLYPKCWMNPGNKAK